jgi:hypothetical protein
MLNHNGPESSRALDPDELAVQRWEEEGGALAAGPQGLGRSAAEAARLRRLFASVEPVEVTAMVDLQDKTPREIARLLPRFTTMQQSGNAAFAFLVDNGTGRIFALRSGLAPYLHETLNGIPFKTGTMTRATAEAAGGVWGRPGNPLGAHVEGQAAAFMRARGIMDATLYINATNPCYGTRGCYASLPTMLAEGSTLTVFNKNGRQFPPFTGAP